MFGSVEIEDVLIKLKTDKAVLCVFEDGREIWIPQRLIHDDSEVWDKGHEGTLVIPEWLAEKEGLI